MTAHTVSRLSTKIGKFLAFCPLFISGAL